MNYKENTFCVKLFLYPEFLERVPLALSTLKAFLLSEGTDPDW